MFTYKTDAQLEAMTPAERDTYAAEKRAYEAGEAKKAIDEAVKAAKIEVEKDFDAKLTKKLAEKNTEIETLKTTVEDQGKKIVQNSISKSATKKENLEDIFKAKYDEAVSKTDTDAVVREPFTMDTKNTVSTDVMTVGAVNSTDFPTAGSTQATPSAIQTLFGKLIGYFGYRKPTSRILDLVDVQPMDSATLIVVTETVTGDAEITAEATLKPVAKVVFNTEEKSAEEVSVEWNTTTKLRRFFPSLVNRMVQKFTELVNDKLPKIVLDAIKAAATAFTPNAAFMISETPNNYDALGAVIASLENLGKLPSAIVLNPIAWRNMKQLKDDNGNYALSNGSSITILNDALDWGNGAMIRIIKDPEIGIDEFVVADLFDAVKVGVDSALMYFETDGRTDSNTSSTSGLSRSIRTHVLSKFFAVMIPTPNRIGIVSDTFSNVKTLITLV